MGIIILAVLVLGYIGLAFMASKTWQVLHVVLLCGIFFGTVGFAILAAGNLKTQGKYRSELNRLEKDLAREEARTNELLNGNPNTDEDGEPSLLALQGNLRRGLIDRGRVWRNMAVSNMEGEDALKITLDASAWGNDGCFQAAAGDDEFEDEEIEPVAADGDGAAPAAGAEKPLGLIVGAYVYAFSEAPMNSLEANLQKSIVGDNTFEGNTNGLCKIPTAFLGEFQVTSADGTTVELESTATLGEREKRLVRESQFSWVLYEEMPLDSHDIFRGMESEQLQTLFNQQQLGMEPGPYAALINEYSRDQQQGTDADPPERKWVKVKFTAAHEITVDMQEAVPDATSPFDSTGRSQLELLRQGEPTKFSKDDEAFFDSATASTLPANVVDSIYVRRLRNYQQAFRTLKQEQDEVSRVITSASEDLQLLNESIAKLKAQIDFRTEERTKLNQDNDGFAYERQVIAGYGNALTTKLSNLKRELSRLYTTNRGLAGGALASGIQQ